MFPLDYPFKFSGYVNSKKSNWLRMLTIIDNSPGDFWCMLLCSSISAGFMPSVYFLPTAHPVVLSLSNHCSRLALINIMGWKNESWKKMFCRNVLCLAWCTDQQTEVLPELQMGRKLPKVWQTVNVNMLASLSTHLEPLSLTISDKPGGETVVMRGSFPSINP